MIRDAQPTIDAPAICDIYNRYVCESHCTFEMEPVEPDEMFRRLIGSQRGGFPFLVSEFDGNVVGYAYGHRFRSREAYGNTVEVSVYVETGVQGRRVGAALYTQLLPEICSRGAHAVLAGIALPNDASVKLHERFGFIKVAHFREVGRKFSRWIDVGYWELLNR